MEQYCVFLMFGKEMSGLYKSPIPSQHFDMVVDLKEYWYAIVFDLIMEYYDIDLNDNREKGVSTSMGKAQIFKACHGILVLCL